MREIGVNCDCGHWRYYWSIDDHAVMRVLITSCHSNRTNHIHITWINRRSVSYCFPLTSLNNHGATGHVLSPYNIRLAKIHLQQDFTHISGRRWGTGDCLMHPSRCLKESSVWRSWAYAICYFCHLCMHCTWWSVSGKQSRTKWYWCNVSNWN